nr:hypothetical protein [Deltaproteobacteria bacterium]
LFRLIQLFGKMKLRVWIGEIGRFGPLGGAAYFYPLIQMEWFKFYESYLNNGVLKSSSPEQDGSCLTTAPPHSKGPFG